MKLPSSFACPRLLFAFLLVPVAVPALRAQQSPSAAATAPADKSPGNLEDPYRLYDATWDVPPAGSTDLSSRAFRDGVQAGHKDWAAGSHLGYHHQALYRKPPAPRSGHEEYRGAFKVGYERAVQRDEEQKFQADHGAARAVHPNGTSADAGPAVVPVAASSHPQVL